MNSKLNIIFCLSLLLSGYAAINAYRLQDPVLGELDIQLTNVNGNYAEGTLRKQAGRIPAGSTVTYLLNEDKTIDLNYGPATHPSFRILDIAS